ncbi:hypothetical protein HDF08_000826 [Edaphobacter lichenicola]|uniref:Uncharacterized protein n=1 Tax=Tunturiibacter lichenicola TaxID=2051959 RepID=A0A852VD17_9BACT|nr:hypothetical protein [Edaphobacter lichenicola]
MLPFLGQFYEGQNAHAFIGTHRKLVGILGMLAKGKCLWVIDSRDKTHEFRGCLLTLLLVS